LDKLTLDEARKLNDTMVTEEHLKLHAANVSAHMKDRISGTPLSAD